MPRIFFLWLPNGSSPGGASSLRLPETPERHRWLSRGLEAYLGLQQSPALEQGQQKALFMALPGGRLGDTESRLASAPYRLVCLSPREDKEG